MFSSSIFSSLGTVSGATQAAIFMIIILALIIIIKITKMPLLKLISNLIKSLIRFFGRAINKKEESYHRDLAIGKINSKRKTYKFYNFLNDLLIDLNLIQYGISPYELLFIVSILTLAVVSILCRMIFGTFLIAIIMFPIALVGVFCIMYTKANIAHDQRIESVIEAENIICNNIKIGVVAAVRDSMNVLPKNIRPYFKEFLDNVEQQNYHIKTALQELNAKLGSVADDFIKKCIVFELEEEHGIAGMFQDIVEVNNINMEMRTEMKRAFEEVTFNFKIGAGMIFTFLAAVLIIFPEVRNWYFTTTLGAVVIALDILILIMEYVIITYLRAKEL